MQSPELYVKYLFFVVGYGGMAYSFITMYLSHRARYWMRTKATIVSSTIETSCDDEGCTHEAKVEYEYSVYGKSYFSKKIAFGYAGNSFRYFANRVAGKYIRGNTAIVYFNPKNPGKSVLLVGIRPFHIFNIIFFLLFIVMVHNVYANGSSDLPVDADGPGRHTEDRTSAWFARPGDQADVRTALSAEPLDIWAYRDLSGRFLTDVPGAQQAIILS